VLVPSDKRAAPRLSRRIYGATEREALIVLREASDRVCAKRLKAIIPPGRQQSRAKENPAVRGEPIGEGGLPRISIPVSRSPTPKWG